MAEPISTRKRRLRRSSVVLQADLEALSIELGGLQRDVAAAPGGGGSSRALVSRGASPTPTHRREVAPSTPPRLAVADTPAQSSTFTPSPPQALGYRHQLTPPKHGGDPHTGAPLYHVYSGSQGPVVFPSRRMPVPAEAGSAVRPANYFMWGGDAHSLGSAGFRLCRVGKPATIRADFRVDAPTVGVLEPGGVVVIAEWRTLTLVPGAQRPISFANSKDARAAVSFPASGSMRLGGPSVERLRCRWGWVSATSNLTGEQLLFECDPQCVKYPPISDVLSRVHVLAIDC
jgi:hypothetical protein